MFFILGDVSRLTQAILMSWMRQRLSLGRPATHQIKVPEQYIGASVWVSDFFGQQVEIRCGTRTIGTYDL